MSNILTDLSRQKEKAADEFKQNSAVKEVLLLQEENAAEDLRIALALGGQNSIKRAIDEKGRKIQLEHLDKKYAGNVFTRAQIKDVARKYNLRFLPVNRYNGGVPVETIAKIKEFAKETNTEITNGNLSYNFYMLAPEKCFSLNKIPKKRS